MNTIEALGRSTVAETLKEVAYRTALPFAKLGTMNQ